MFLGWFDDDRKKTASMKIEEAVERYVAKYGERPTVCLLNATDQVSFDGLEIKVVEYVRPNHFWIGQPENPSPSLAA